MNHCVIREGDTVTFETFGSLEPLMLRLLDAVFACARSVGYTDIQFSVKRGESNWKRWTGESPPSQGSSTTKGNDQ
jgi:hypothetical protein